MPLALVACDGVETHDEQHINCSIGSSAAGLQMPVFTDVTSTYLGGLTNKVSEDDVPAGASLAAEKISFIGAIGVTDLNQDKYPDFYISYGNEQSSRLFLNQQGDSFLDQANSYGVELNGYQTSAIFADLNKDGDDELLLGYLFEDALQIYELDNGKYVQVDLDGSYTQSGVMGIAVGDADNDGDLDIATARWGESNGDDFIWYQTGNLFFENDASLFSTANDIHNENCGSMRTAASLNVLFTPNFADLDKDGLSDLVVAGDFASSRVLINDNDLGLTDTSSSNDLQDCNAMGAALGDYDNDGDLDWFVSSIYDPDGEAEGNWGVNGNRLYANNGLGEFSDVSDIAGIEQGFWGWGSCMADFNNDGWLDIFHVNGFGEEGQVSREEFYQDLSRMFISDQQGGFTEVSVSIGINDDQLGRGVSCADIDLDGDVDILITNNGQKARLYKNEMPPTNYLHLQVKGQGSVQHAIGAKVELTTGSNTQYREVRVANNFMGQQPRTLHFGLGESCMVDEVKVSWPDGSIDDISLTNVSANQYLEISPDN